MNNWKLNPAKEKEQHVIMLSVLSATEILLIFHYTIYTTSEWISTLTLSCINYDNLTKDFFPLSSAFIPVLTQHRTTEFSFFNDKVLFEKMLMSINNRIECATMDLPWSWPWEGAHE